MDILTIRIAAEPDVARVRQIIGGIAEVCGLESFAKTRVVTATLEVTRNALQYAGGGRAHFSIQSGDEGCWLVARIVDQGSGLPDEVKFVKGRRPFKNQSGGSRASGMGLGLTGVQRLADRFDLETSNEGTKVEMAFRIPVKSQSAAELVERIHDKVQELSATDPIAELSRQNRELAEAMAERELLIDEVHHRTGNNLALIVSFIQLSKRSAQNEETIEAMTQLEARVLSVAKVHQELQRANLADKVSLIPLLEQVAKHSQDAFSSEDFDIAISVFGDDVRVSGSAAIDIGLIVNELITNAFKHAFTEQSGGRIEVTFEPSDEDAGDAGWVLTVKDNGKGLTSDERPERSNSLGWRMIRAMSSRLSGTIETGTDHGFFARLTFPSTLVNE